MARKEKEPKEVREEVELAIQQFEDPRANEIMEHVRKKLATAFGVTVSGPYVALRTYIGDRFVCVSLNVTSITDSTVLEPPMEDH